MNAKKNKAASTGLPWYFALCFFLAVQLSSFAQPFHVGLHAGLVTSQVDGDTYGGYNKAGLYAGGFVSKRLAENSKWTALFEINYIQKGSRKVPRPDKGDYTDYRLKLDYAEVPILFKRDFAFRDTSGENRMSFGLFGGIAFGALVNSAEWDAFGPVRGGTPFEKVDFSYVVGLNYSLTEHIGFEARTQYSVLPVRKGGTSVYYANWTFKFFKPGYYNNLLVFALKYHL